MGERQSTKTAEVIVVGAGLAGLSAAIYLGRAKRDTLVLDFGKSMAHWEPDVQNYLGFPQGIGGADLVKFGQKQAKRYHIRFQRDHIISGRFKNGSFKLRG